MPPAIAGTLADPPDPRWPPILSIALVVGASVAAWAAIITPIIH